MNRTISLWIMLPLAIVLSACAGMLNDRPTEGIQTEQTVGADAGDELATTPIADSENASFPCKLRPSSDGLFVLIITRPGSTFVAQCLPGPPVPFCPGAVGYIIGTKPGALYQEKGRTSDGVARADIAGFAQQNIVVTVKRCDYAEGKDHAPIAALTHP